MPITLNAAAVANARAKIAAGEVDAATKWSVGAKAEFLVVDSQGDWKAFSVWFLGVNPSQPPAVQSRYAYAYGRGGKVYRSGLVAVKELAERKGDTAIAQEAASLVTFIDAEKAADDAAKAAAQAEAQAKAAAVKQAAAGSAGFSFTAPATAIEPPTK